MPDSSADRDPLERLAEEFVARFRRGERPSLTEYADRLPDRAGEVRDLFPALVEMEHLKPGTADRTGDYAPPADPSVPQQLGEFRILRRVGVGGMGVVYEAVQESLGRHVALKLLPTDALADPRRLERFRREAKAAARLHHTNIVPVFGTGEAGGRHFYAMQFIAGHPLDAVIDEVRRLKDRSAAPIGRAVSEVAAALVTGTFAAGEALASRERERPEDGRLGASTSPPGFAGGEVGVAATPGEGGKASRAVEVSPPHPPGYRPTTSPPQSRGRGGSNPPVAHAPGSPSAPSLSDGGRSYFATVARVGAQVADALSYAHAQGVLHRDIKPANLLLDLQGTVWVTDFGLAKSADADDLTHAGDVVGTLRYMAPERFDGPGDARSDTYALGLTLYELLTLTPAFAADTQAKLVEQVLAANPPKPRAVNPSIPRDLETVVLKAIARDPAMRYQSATELADDLRRYTEDRPIRARRASSAEQAFRWCRRNKAVASLIAAVLLVLALGAAVATFFAFSADKEREVALYRGEQLDLQRRRAQDEADAAERASRDAQVSADSFRRQLYFNQIALAQQYWRADDSGQADRLLSAAPPELRGWEWGYLDRLRRPELLSLPGNGQFTTGLSLSADGKRMAAVAQTGTAGVRVWDLTTNRAVTEISSTDTGRQFNAGTITPDGKTVATGERGGAVALWDAGTGKLVKELGKLSGQVATVSASPDGVMVLAATRGDVGKPDWRIWNVATGEVVPTPAGVKAAIAFAPGGRVLGWKRNPDRFIRSSLQEYLGVLYDFATGTEERVLGPMRSWAFTGDGKRMAVGGWDEELRPQVRVISLADSKPVMTASASELGDLAFSPDGKLLAAAGSFSRPIDIWDVAAGRKLRTLRGHRHFVNALAFCPDGRLASCSWDNTIRFWDSSADQEVVRLPGRGAEAPSAAAVHPHGTGVAFVQGGRVGGARFPLFGGNWSDPVYLWEPGGKSPRLLTGPARSTTRVGYAAGGTRLISGDQAGQVIVWDVAAGTRLGSVRHEGRTEAVALSSDGRWAASSHEPPAATGARSGAGKLPYEPIRGVARVWDAATGAERFRLEGHLGRVYAVAFSPDGATIATAGVGELRLWDAVTGELRREVTDREIRSDGLAFDPTGRTVATAGEEGVRLWDAATGAKLIDLPGQAGNRFSALAFTPDGSRVVTAFGRVVRLWDAATGQEIMTLPTLGDDRVLALGFTADGRRLLAAMYDGGVQGLGRRPRGQVTGSRRLDQNLFVWSVDAPENARRISSAY